MARALAAPLPVDLGARTRARFNRQSKTPRGRVRRMFRHYAGAEGATAPETLRPMDREGMTLWKASRRVSQDVRIHRRA
jgi:hypothetical protein